MTEPERFADYLLIFTRRRYAIFDDEGGRVVAPTTLAGPMGDNEIEYRTLLAALRGLWQKLGARAALTVLVVRGDSQTVIDQVLGYRKPEDEHLRQLRDETRQLLGDFKRYRLVWQSPEDTQASLGS